MNLEQEGIEGVIRGPRASVDVDGLEPKGGNAHKLGLIYDIVDGSTTTDMPSTNLNDTVVTGNADPATRKLGTISTTVEAFEGELDKGADEAVAGKLDLVHVDSSTSTDLPSTNVNETVVAGNADPAARKLGAISTVARTTDAIVSLTAASRKLGGIYTLEGADGEQTLTSVPAGDGGPETNGTVGDFFHRARNQLDKSPAARPAPLPAPAPAPTVRPGAFPQRGIAASGQFNSYSLVFGLDDEEIAAAEMRDRETGLVCANPVPQSELDHLESLEVAEPVEDTKNSPDDKSSNQRRKQYSLLGLVLVLVVVVIIGVATGFKKDPAQQESQSTAAPSAPPTREALMAVLPLATQEIILQDSNAIEPQSKAYKWLRDDPKIQEYSSDRLLQRFVMATFYYASNGDNWIHKGGGTVSVMVPAMIAGHHSGGPPPDPASQPEGASPLNGDVRFINVTHDAWLNYSAHECDWFFSFEGTLCPGDNETVQSIRMVNNGLAGTLPQELSLLPSLSDLEIFINNVGGSLMTEIGAMSRLRRILLNSNKFIGTIPTQIGQLSNKLEILSILDNQFEKSLPDQVWKLSLLFELKASKNALTGTLPNNFGSLLPNLKVLFLAYNQFAGMMPSTVGQCSGLQLLDTSENLMTGSLPSELGRLTSLTHLKVQNNNWSGTLPSQVGLLPNVQTVWLHQNPRLTGTIPAEWSFLNGTLLDLSLAGTGITGTIPSSLCQIETLNFDCGPTLCGCSHCPCLSNNVSN